MPLSNEKISNRPLSGAELKERILSDVRRVLDKDNLFADYLGYGQVSYKVTVEMATNNPFLPSATVKTGEGSLEGEFEERGGAVLERSIDSPNVERIAMGLPLKIYSPAGSTEIEYGKEMIPDYKEPEVKDITPQVKQRWNKK